MSTATKTKKSDDDVGTALAVVTLKETLRLLQGQVGALERQVAAQQAEIRDLKETPRDPSIVERLVPREIFAEGAQLLDEYVQVQVRLKELKREHEDLDDRWNRANAKLRDGKYGDGVIPPDNEEQVRADKKRLGEAIAAKWAEIEAAEAERDELGKKLSRFSRIRVLPNRLPDNVEVQE